MAVRTAWNEFLVGEWVSTSPAGPGVIGSDRLVVTRDTLTLTNPEAIVNASESGGVITVRTGTNSTYMFERMARDEICLITPRRAGVIYAPPFRSGRMPRPPVQDGMVTVNCYRRRS